MVMKTDIIVPIVKIEQNGVNSGVMNTMKDSH